MNNYSTEPISGWANILRYKPTPRELDNRHHAEKLAKDNGLYKCKECGAQKLFTEGIKKRNFFCDSTCHAEWNHKYFSMFAV